LRPRMPATISAMQTIRAAVAGSAKRTMPAIVPMCEAALAAEGAPKD
jgi:hypothetical protein